MPPRSPVEPRLHQDLLPRWTESPLHPRLPEEREIRWPAGVEREPVRGPVRVPACPVARIRHALDVPDARIHRLLGYDRR